MRAWVSPPHESVVQAVAVAAIMAQAASTALPPRSKILAPAAAAIGLPVTAIQCCPYSAGFWVRPWACGPPNITLALTIAVIAVRAKPLTPGPVFFVFFRVRMRASSSAGRKSIWQTLRRRTPGGAARRLRGGGLEQQVSVSALFVY